MISYFSLLFFSFSHYGISAAKLDFGSIILPRNLSDSYSNNNLLLDSGGTGDHGLLFNDPSLGDDWINSNDVDNKTMLDRHKRAVGTTLDEAIFKFDSVASQVISETQIDVGDSYTFRVELDLPQVPADMRSDLKVEIFALTAEQKVGGFHICQTHVPEVTNSRGIQLKAVQQHPVYEEDPFTQEGAENLIERAVVTMEQLHTDDKQSDPDNSQEFNIFQVQFQAVAVDFPGAELGEMSPYAITAGIEYGHGEYVWIGQMEVVTDIAVTTYDNTFEFENPPASPIEIKKGRGHLFTVKASITQPVSDLKFSVTNPLGYDDIFHIGDITRDVGNAFGCSPEENWKDERRFAPSGLNVMCANASYDKLVNREATRDVTNNTNFIYFFVPITVMNMEDTPVNIVRMATFHAEINNIEVWSGTADIKIMAADTQAPPDGVPVKTKTVLLNDMTASDGKIVAGDSIIYKVTLTCDGGQWCTFDTTITGDSSLAKFSNDKNKQQQKAIGGQQ